jgi:hypothetical protein
MMRIRAVLFGSSRMAPGAEITTSGSAVLSVAGVGDR